MGASYTLILHDARALKMTPLDKEGRDPRVESTARTHKNRDLREADLGD